MLVLVSDKMYISDLGTQERLIIEKDLTQDNPEYVSRVKRGLSLWGIPKKECYYTRTFDGLSVPRGYLGQFLNRFPSTEVVFKTVEGAPAHFGSWEPNIVLRSYQNDAVDNALSRNGVIVCAAGGGKTLIGLNYIHKRSKKALWIAHTRELMNQVKDRVNNYFSCSVGIVQGSNVDLSKDITIASVKTLALHPEITEDLNKTVGTVVVDEMHRYAAPMFNSVVAKLKASNIIGLTATPERKDNRDMLMFYSVGEQLCNIDRFMLYDLGFLIKPKIKFVYTSYDFNQSSKKSKNGAVDAGGGDYDFHELIADLIENEERFQLIVDNIVANHKENNYQIVLSESVEYGQKFFDELTALGFCCEFMHGKVPKKKRLDIMNRCYNKEVPVLIATKLANEGLDMPHLNIGHLTTPKRGDEYKRADGAALEQQIGRIMRPSGSGKTWYDYVDDRNGILKAQYYTRRRTYKRLGLEIPKKPKDININNWLHNFR